MRKTRIAAVAAGMALLFAAAAMSEEITYTKHIRPLFDARCSFCHGPDAAPEYSEFKKEKDKWLAQGKGMRMDTYSHLIFFTAWPDTGSLMRRLNDGSGVEGSKPGNMYQFLGDTEQERQNNLELFRKWVGNWTLKRWNEVSKEDLDSIRVEY